MKMYFEFLLVIIAILLLIYLFFIFAKTVVSPEREEIKTGSVCVEPFNATQGKCFLVEVVKTPAQREEGLMRREKLDKDKGMLFIFEKEGIYPFWMKNTLIPLDIIWVDSQGKIVYISENAQPCKNLICPQIVPDRKVSYVLEINAGLCQEFGIEVGNKLGINIY